MFGAPIPLTLILDVEGRKITGTWSTQLRDDRPRAMVEGRLITERTATIRIQGRAATWALTLIGNNTLEYSEGGLSSGELTRQGHR